MDHPLYPSASKDVAQKRKELVPDILAAFQSFSQHVFADGALPSRIKELIAVAAAHVTQCPYCIRGHTKRARQKGVSEQEIIGSDLGGRRNAGWRSHLTLCPCNRHDERRGSQGGVT